MQHQFVNPAQLFVQPPLPTAPRSRYIHPSQYGELSPISTPAASTPPMAPVASSTPSQATSVQVALPPSPQPNTHLQQSQSNLHTQQPQPIVKAEPSQIQPQPSPKVELKKPPPTPQTSVLRPQPTPSPMTNHVPQVMMIPAPSPEVQAKMQKPHSKKQQQKRQPIQQTADKSAKPPKPTKPSVDYQVLLLSLADEYLNAAHSHGTTTALVTREADIGEYYKLVATGLGCLEAVLKVGRKSLFFLVSC